MLQAPMDVLTQFPVRNRNKEKQIFRDAVCSYAQHLHYPVTIEQGSFGCRNMIFGDPEKAKYLLTAHYDTPPAMLFPNLITPTKPLLYSLYRLFLMAMLLVVPIAITLVLGLLVLLAGITVVPEEYSHIVIISIMIIWYVGFPLLVLLGIVLRYFGPGNKNNANDNTSGVVTLLEIAKSLPDNLRSQVCIVFFDMEEKGCIGSRSYRRLHKSSTDQQLVINLDCVGDGDHLRIFPTKKLRNDRKTLTSFHTVCGYFGKKDLLVHEKGFGCYPSDQSSFPNAVGICALKKGKHGLYLSKIHTKNDTVLDITNVNILRAALISYISRNAVN